MTANAVLVIAKREYLSRIRSKGFWISTIALPILMAAWMFIPSLVMSKTRSSQQLAVVDWSGKVAPALAEKLAEFAQKTDDRIHFTVEIVPATGKAQALRETLDRRVLDGEVQAWVWINDQLGKDDLVEYHSESVSNFITQQSLERALSSVVRKIRLEEAGYDPEVVGDLTRSVELETIKISEGGSRAEGGFGGFALAIGLFMVLYMTTLIYGQQVMLGVLDEKASRVVEVVISSVTPTELMIGKLSGICLIGLTQLGIWVGTALLLTAPAVLGAIAFLPAAAQIPSIPAIVLIHFLLLFLCGFFLYATFYAMVGAAFNNPQEAQQLASLAVIFVVLPWMFFFPVVNDPDSKLAVISSLIPMLTPFLMMVRIAIKMPPTWQIVLGYVLTVSFCAVMIWACARVYRVGILMYGKKPTFKELWRWMRYA